MLTVAGETLWQLAAEHGKELATHLYGQEINAETNAICKADLLLRREGEAVDNIVDGPKHSPCPTTPSHVAPRPNWPIAPQRCQAEVAHNEVKWG